MKSSTSNSSPQSAEHSLNLQLQQQFTSAHRGSTEGSGDPNDVLESLWSRVQPVAASSPTLIAHSAEMASLLDLNINSHPVQAARLFTGNVTPDSSTLYAMRYGGHQFGSWAGQLGDGRAIALGEVTDTQHQHWTLQLKGAGPTPYSRHGDGFAVLRSSIREYLCSEAMHHLGIPTTRSLTLCLTGDQIDRDIFYNGNVQPEPGAILCRAAHSFVRFGSFEIHAAHRELEQLRGLANYTIKLDYPHLWPTNGQPTIDTYQQWFSEIMQRTASLMAHWQRVGFVHAVMNTDNMSILGQTIDYGPYGWLEEYDPQWTPNFIDQQMRRYSYGNQPQMGKWNLYRLANAVLPLFDDDTQPLKDVLATYDDLYNNLWNNISAAKIGLADVDKQSGDDELLRTLWATLKTTSTDFTMFFRKLATINPTESNAEERFESILAAFYQPLSIDNETKEQFTAWLTHWAARVANHDTQKMHTLMNATNPKYILRNYVAQQAIDAAENKDYSIIHELAEVLKNPYAEQPQFDKYAAIRPEWASQRPDSTMLTCSS